MALIDSRTWRLLPPTGLDMQKTAYRFQYTYISICMQTHTNYVFFTLRRWAYIKASTCIYIYYFIHERACECKMNALARSFPRCATEYSRFLRYSRSLFLFWFVLLFICILDVTFTTSHTHDGLNVNNTLQILREVILAFFCELLLRIMNILPSQFWERSKKFLNFMDNYNPRFQLPFSKISMGPEKSF